jgi:tetratricopeptide (TPR) repeat protein
MNERLRTRLQFSALVGCLLLLGASGSALGQYVRPNAPGDRELDGAGWEGRRLLAQLLWVKTHAVLHAGVEERDARPGESKTRAGEFHQHGGASKQEIETPEPGHEEPSHEGHGHDEHGEEGHVFVIPPAREDFRGVLGDLERAVKPYAGTDGKLYGKDTSQTLPFYRLMTWADPHFIQGYTVGSTFINKVGKETRSALQFLLEGERFNPDSFEIQTELGHLYLVYEHDYAAAEKHLQRAISLLPHRKLTEMEEEARMDACRWLALDYVQWDKPAEAVQFSLRARAQFGPDATLDHVIQRHGKK